MAVDHARQKTHADDAGLTEEAVAVLAAQVEAWPPSVHSALSLAELGTEHRPLLARVEAEGERREMRGALARLRP